MNTKLILAGAMLVIGLVALITGLRMLCEPIVNRPKSRLLGGLRTDSTGLLYERVNGVLLPIGADGKPRDGVLLFPEMKPDPSINWGTHTIFRKDGVEVKAK